MLDGLQPSNTKFGFFLQTEGNLLRVNDIRYDARARLWAKGARYYEWMRALMGRHVPDLFGDSLSVIVTLLHSPWKPASSRMRPLHLETRIYARGH